MEANRPRSRFGMNLTLFGVAGLTAFLLIVAACVEWLSRLLGSMALAALICGGFFALIALLIYFCALHEALRQFRAQVETVYEVAHAVQAAYRRMLRTALTLLRLL